MNAKLAIGDLFYLFPYVIAILCLVALPLLPFLNIYRKDVKKSKEMRTYWKEQFKADMEDPKHRLLRPHTVANESLLRVPVECEAETLLRPTNVFSNDPAFGTESIIPDDHLV